MVLYKIDLNGSRIMSAPESSPNIAEVDRFHSEIPSNQGKNS